MMRDISSAYLADMKGGSCGFVDDVARSRLLLERLEALDYRFITGFPSLNNHLLACNR